MSTANCGSLIDAICIKIPNNDSQVHLEQGGLICLLGKLTDLIKEVLDSCNAARKDKK